MTIRGALVIFVLVVEEWLLPEDAPVVVVVAWAPGVEAGAESVCEVDGVGFATEAGCSVAPVDCPDDPGVETVGLEFGLGFAVVVVVAAVVVVGGVVVVVAAGAGAGAGSAGAGVAGAAGVVAAGAVVAAAGWMFAVAGAGVLDLGLIASSNCSGVRRASARPASRSARAWRA